MRTAIMIISIILSISGLAAITFEGRRPRDLEEQVMHEISRYYLDRWGLWLITAGSILYLIGLYM